MIEVRRRTNVFGTWWVTKWPAMPPEAPVAAYTAHWVTDEGRFRAPATPTLGAAIAAIPITTGES